SSTARLSLSVSAFSEAVAIAAAAISLARSFSALLLASSMDRVVPRHCYVSALQAFAHEFLALVAFLAIGLGVAVLHALLLLLLGRARAIVLQALAHEFLALVALLALGLGVAVLHALLLLLLRGGWFLFGFLLLLRLKRQGDKRERQRGDQEPDHFSSRRFSMAATSCASSGATRVSKLCTRLPPRSTRYLWKFHFGACPAALTRSE